MHRAEYDRLYRIWKAMRARCNNPNTHAYERYGGRGIKVCAEWEVYDVFHDWALSHGYTDRLTIDRIDNDGDYCPENCRWITIADQQQSKSSSHFISFNGKTQNLTQWAKEYNMPRERLQKRLRLGWPLERALTEVVA